MSEPLVLKVGDLTPPVVVRLTDEDGQAVDLTNRTVTFTLRMAAPPYTVVIDAAPTQNALNQSDPDFTGIVTYYWQPGDTDVAGDYLGSMIDTDGPQTYPAYDFIRVTISSVSPPEFLAITPGAVETAIGRAMTATETARAIQLIEQVTDLLSLWLRRDLVPTTYTDETHRADVMGRVFLNHGPVRSIISITVDGSDYDFDPLYLNPQNMVFTPDSEVKITYESGDSAIHPAVQGVITESVARAVLAGSQISTGAITGYSVEGTSITYGPVVGAQGSVGRVPVSDLSSVRRLKRRYAT